MLKSAPEVPCMDEDGPEFVSPPFPIIFLTVVKVIMSVLIVLAALGIIAFAISVAVLYLSD